MLICQGYRGIWPKGSLGFLQQLDRDGRPTQDSLCWLVEHPVLQDVCLVVNCGQSTHHGELAVEYCDCPTKVAPVELVCSDLHYSRAIARSMPGQFTGRPGSSSRSQLLMRNLSSSLGLA